MKDRIYLNLLFKSYYKNKKDFIPIVDKFEKREFGFFPWADQIMIRHKGFIIHYNFLDYLAQNGPKHVYYSGALYKEPHNPNINNKKYLGCDLIFDIDVDHFYTPCKKEHDVYHCQKCGYIHNGMGIKKCPKCKSTKFKRITWICGKCLNYAKNEIIKLIDSFLKKDFGFDKSNFKITFSGHRGYHLKIEEDKIRNLDRDDRREIIDYLTGTNLSLELLGLKTVGDNIYGLSKSNLGWSYKILTTIEMILNNWKKSEIINFFRRNGLRGDTPEIFLNYKKEILDIISNDKILWNLEGIGMNTWRKIILGVVKEAGVEIDEPVSIDIHRLIRYPDSLHGKTGFKAQELTLEQLKKFNPLNESNIKIDPIVFFSEKIKNIEIIEDNVPEIKIKGITYGPYLKGDTVEVPHHIAIFLLCKEVAKLN